ncbi:MAG: hypothetical protein WCL34_15225 [Methylococcaceae bacterium]|jgi:hypothetical protein
MSDKTEWLKKYVSGDDLPKAIEDFDTAFTIAASNFENDGWFVDDCVNFIYDHISEYVEEFTDETIKNAIDMVFVENVVDATADDILGDDDEDLKLTKSQKDFMGGGYHDEYDPEEYDDEDELLDDNFYDE